MVCSDDVRLSAPCSVDLCSCVLMQTMARMMTMMWTCLLASVLTFPMLVHEGDNHDDLNDDFASVCPVFCTLFGFFPVDDHDDDDGDIDAFSLFRASCFACSSCR